MSAMGWYEDLEGDPRSKREPAARRRANVQPLQRSIGESAAVGGPFARTIRADAVTELHVAVPPHVRLELFPAALVGEHAVAGGADLYQTL